MPQRRRNAATAARPQQVGGRRPHFNDQGREEKPGNQKKYINPAAHSNNGADSTPPPERQQQVGSTLSGQAWSPESAASVPPDKPGSTRTQQPTRQLHPPRHPAAASTPSTSAYQDPSPSPRMRPALQRHNPPGSRPQDATDPSTAAPRLIKSKRLQCRLATQALRNQRLYSLRRRQHPNVPGVSGTSATCTSGGRGTPTGASKKSLRAHELSSYLPRDTGSTNNRLAPMLS